MNNEYQILITNDDGVHAPGIRALAECLPELGRVVVVAPASEKSAVSHGLTLQSPLRIQQLEKDRYAVDGTPADCILVAMNKILEKPPKLVVSGINTGANLGDDLFYSGTVAGAREGSMYGLPAIAFSLKFSAEMDYAAWARKALAICRETMANPLPTGIFLNVNFPAGQPNGVRVTRQSRKFARSTIYENNDPRGKKYYWIGEDESSWDDSDDTDFWAITHGYTSITPLHRDQTSYDLIEGLRRIHGQG